jgi:hypothetical protein
MKLLTLAAASCACAAFIGGTVVAQTMEPVPNPPEKPHMAMHHMKGHHHMARHHMAKHHAARAAAAKADDTAAAPK